MEYSVVRLPVLARPLHFGKSILGLNLRLALKKLYTKTGRHVEGDMAVHQPCSWVVRLEGKDEVTSGREIGCVSTDGIIGLEPGNVTIPNGILLLVQNVEVVPVKMDGMG